MRTSRVNSMAPVVRVRNLRKSYGELTAVSDVSFDVAEGEIFGILGPNGAGKTTTVETLQGLRGFDSGEVAVLGLDPRREPQEIRRRVGSQLQQSALPDRMKVWEALDLFGSLSEQGPDPEELLGEWGLSERRDARFASLSGGEQQRLFIALALINDPPLVFLDEMTTGLDPSARRVAWSLIEKMRDNGRTVVLVTHFMDEAERLCDRLVVIDRGTVVAEGSPADLIDRYADGATLTFSTSRDDISWLAEVPYVDDVRSNHGRVTVHGHGPVLVHVASALLARGLQPADLLVKRASLEDVFLELTGEEQ